MASVRKTMFNNDWLSNLNWSSWLTRCSDNPCVSRCKICVKNFALSNMGKQAIISHEKSTGHKKNVEALTNSDLATIPLIVGATKQPKTEVTGKSESTVSKLSTSSLQTATPKLHQMCAVTGCRCAGCTCQNNVVLEDDTASLIHAVS